MPSINAVRQEITFKIVYQGPGLSGKTTCLNYIFNIMATHPANTPRVRQGWVYDPSPLDDPDETVIRLNEVSWHFSFYPPITRRLDGTYRVRLELHVCANQSIFRHPAQAEVLEHADGILFVADSQSVRLEANVESDENLREYLSRYGFSYEDMPIVLQCNKRDMPDIVSIHKIQQSLKMQDRPIFESVAVRGIGVIESLKEVTRLMLARYRGGGTRSAAR